MAALDQKPQNDNKENVSPSMMVKPLDYCTSLDKDITQIKMRRKRSRRQPLKDITNLFVSSPPLSSSFMCVGLKAAAATSSTFSCKKLR
ncbi:hypothetical protein BRARA_A00964 [Brassica rapa]|uniref:Uncharacterized protein n=1 Tax=Brassica campestris TaxID=3711 RepID=A0A398AR52_BRACM|nr:hypothetical protein BRARA_A00964 [Brassica rapa]